MRRALNGRRSGGLASRLDDALVEVALRAAAAPSRADPAVTLELLARVVAGALGANSGVVATWSGAPAPPEPQRWWGWPAGEVPGAPGRGDLVVARGRLTLGYLRFDPVPDRPTKALLAPAADLAAVLIDQRATRRRVAELQRRSAEARAALTEERRAAAVEMDLVRRSLERDLHDGVQGDLVALTVQVALLEHALQVPEDAAAVPMALVVRQALAVRDQITATAEGISPAALRHGGLEPALRAELPPLPPPGRLRLDVRPGAAGRRWPQEVETAAYFVCLEAVSNAAKHATGADVVVRVDSLARGLLVEVADDGPGFDGPPPPGSFRALRERAALVGGSLEVRSAAGVGTIVTLLVPY